jgi:hypothetical protein
VSRWLVYLVVFGLFVLIITAISRLLQRPVPQHGEDDEDEVVDSGTALTIGVIIVTGMIATVVFFAGLHFIFGVELL